MSAVAYVMREQGQPDRVVWYCSGCTSHHQVPVTGGQAWSWNGSVERPTLAPSVRVQWTFGEQHQPRCCHCFVRDGRIEYCGDCTHSLAGRTVEMEPIVEEGGA